MVIKCLQTLYGIDANRGGYNLGCIPLRKEVRIFLAASEIGMEVLKLAQIHCPKPIGVKRFS